MILGTFMKAILNINNSIYNNNYFNYSVPQ